MRCPKCGAENEDGTIVCNSCGESIEIAYPREVFLNQISKQYGAPINLPLEIMALKMLGKNKLWLIIGVGVFFLLAFILAYITAKR